MRPFLQLEASANLLFTHKHGEKSLKCALDRKIPATISICSYSEVKLLIFQRSAEYVSRFVLLVAHYKDPAHRTTPSYTKKRDVPQSSFQKREESKL